MAARREHLLIGQRPTGQLHQHILKLGLGYLPRMVFKNTFDAPAHQVGSLRVRAAQLQITCRACCDSLEACQTGGYLLSQVREGTWRRLALHRFCDEIEAETPVAVTRRSSSVVKCRDCQRIYTGIDIEGPQCSDNSLGIEVL